MHLPRRSVFNMSVYGMKAHPSMLNGLADTMKSRMKICVPSELRRIRHEDIGRLIEANFKSLFVSMCALSFNAEDFRWQVGAFLYEAELNSTTQVFFIDDTIGREESSAWALFGR